MPREARRSNRETRDNPERSNPNRAGGVDNQEGFRRGLYQPETRETGGSSTTSNAMTDFMSVLRGLQTRNTERLQTTTRDRIRQQIWDDGVDQVRQQIDQQIQSFVRDHPHQAERMNNALRPIGQEYQEKLNQLENTPHGQAYKEFAQSPYTPEEKPAAIKQYESEKFEIDIEYASRRLDTLHNIDRQAPSRDRWAY